MPMAGNLRIKEIPGSSEKEGREGTIDVFEVEHALRQPIDHFPPRRQESSRRCQCVYGFAGGLELAPPLTTHPHVPKKKRNTRACAPATFHPLLRSFILQSRRSYITSMQTPAFS